MEACPQVAAVKMNLLLLFPLSLWLAQAQPQPEFYVNARTDILALEPSNYLLEVRTEKETSRMLEANVPGFQYATNASNLTFRTTWKPIVTQTNGWWEIKFK